MIQPLTRRTFPDISGRSHVPAGTIVILGDVGLFCGDKPADLRRQLRIALAVMVAARGRRVRREEIALAVWEDEDRDVRTLMWSLRRALRDCNSGFDVPPDKGREGNYLLTVAEPDTLEEAVDAFRFLQLTREAETLWKGGSELAAVEKLIAAAGLWGGEPFGELWPEGPPETCRKLRSDLEHARDFLIGTLAEAALRQGGPYEAARAYRDLPIGQSDRDPAPGNDAAWLAGFLVALYDRPGSDDADRLLAQRRGIGAGPGAGRDRQAGDDAVTRADDLLLLAEAGTDVHRPLTAVSRPPVAGSPPALVGRETEQAAFGRLLAGVADGHPAGLTVRGASGWGKTRLADEFAAMAVTAGIPVVLVSAAKAGDLRPWQELAERLWPAACRELGTGRDAAARDQVARLTLGQRRALLDFVAPRAGASAPPEPDQAQQVRFAEIARALSALARNVAVRRGLIVLLDDADRLSERGRYLLALVLDGLRDAPVGVALLGRDDSRAEGRGTWTGTLAAARPGAERLMLGPLPEQAIGDWLRQVRGRAPTGGEVHLIARATGGEPVRIRDEVAVAAATVSPQGPSPWLAAAAITADDLVIDTALVARMLDLPDPDADREERIARRLAWIDTSAGVRFTHGSHRDEVIEWLDADPALRRSLHRRAFEALAGDGRHLP